MGCYCFYQEWNLYYTYNVVACFLSNRVSWKTFLELFNIAELFEPTQKNSLIVFIYSNLFIPCC